MNEWHAIRLVTRSGWYIFGETSMQRILITCHSFVWTKGSKHFFNTKVEQIFSSHLPNKNILYRNCHILLQFKKETVFLKSFNFFILLWHFKMKDHIVFAYVEIDSFNKLFFYTIFKSCNISYSIGLTQFISRIFLFYNVFLEI